MLVRITRFDGVKNAAESFQLEGLVGGLKYDRHRNAPIVSHVCVVNSARFVSARFGKLGVQSLSGSYIQCQAIFRIKIAGADGL
jgi:hypothetical protein